jgi:hypothetical protein
MEGFSAQTHRALLVRLPKALTDELRYPRNPNMYLEDDLEQTGEIRLVLPGEKTEQRADPDEVYQARPKLHDNLLHVFLH